MFNRIYRCLIKKIFVTPLKKMYLDTQLIIKYKNRNGLSVTKVFTKF